MLSAGHDNTVKLWDFAQPGKLRQDRSAATAAGSAVPPSRPTATGCSPAATIIEAKLWSIAGYEEVRVFQGRVLHGHADAVLAAAFSPTASEIVTASRDRTAKTWDVATGKSLHGFEEGHDFLASTAIFFPDGKQLLTAAADNTARIWDVTTGTAAAAARSHGPQRGRRRSRTTASLVLTGSDDKTAKLWNAEDRRTLIREHRRPQDSRSHGRRLFARRSHCSPPATRRPLRALERRDRRATEIDAMRTRARSPPLDFVPDSARVLTASSDNTVGQWDVDTGDELVAADPQAQGDRRSLAIVPGRRGKRSCSATTTCARCGTSTSATAAQDARRPRRRRAKLAVSPDGRPRSVGRLRAARRAAVGPGRRSRNSCAGARTEWRRS